MGLHFTALREQAERMTFQAIDTPHPARTYREQIESLALEAKALVDLCKRDNREFNDAEDHRFDEITDKLIPALKVQEAAAIRYEKLQLAGADVGDDSVYPQFGNQQVSTRNRRRRLSDQVAKPDSLFRGRGQGQGNTAFPRPRDGAHGTRPAITGAVAARS